MFIGSVAEDKKTEKRVAITPDLVKKYKSLGLEINLCTDYASHLGIDDKEYISEGANILSNDEVIANSNAIVQMNIPSDENLKKLKKDQILIGVLNPYSNEQKLKDTIDFLKINS